MPQSDPNWILLGLSEESALILILNIDSFINNGDTLTNICGIKTREGGPSFQLTSHRFKYQNL